jgi:uncharacterized protein (TIGR02231 family)
MKKRISISAVLIFVIVCPCLAEKAVPEVVGSISSVIVYRGQALVTRKIETELPKGSTQLIVKKLPAKIVPESLYAQASGNVTILSVRYRQRAVEEDIREEVKQLDAQIEIIKNQIRYADRNRKHAGNLWQRYDNIWKLTVAASNSDFNRGVLQSKEIEELSEYLEAKWNELHKKALELEDKKAELEKELELLNRKREELAAGSSPTEREVVLFVSSEGRKKATIKLSYLVNGANWLPQYNLRANPDKSSVLIEYNAVVNQRSGEDWDGVGLSLSTAEPTMVAAAPTLKPMTVTLTRPRSAATPESQQQVAGPGMAGEFGDIKKLLSARRKQARKGKAAQRELGRLAVSNQMMELKADSRAVDRIQRATKKFARREGVSVTYNLGKGLSMPSRSDQQIVTIAALTADAGFTLVATPLLTDYVYLQAELLNDSDTVLLPGQASMFRNGEFVGKSQLPLVTAGEKFTAGFGIDSQLQVTRELEDKKTRIQGGNRIDTYQYRITLSNYKNTAAELRLLDRLPHNDKDLIKIELLKTEPELSKDSEYLRTTAKKGILRWDMELMPNTIGESATVVTYSFTMEYDKNMQIKTAAVRN